MSAFNVLVGLARCPGCEHVEEFEVQFKYGNTWQNRYKLGDKIQWGGNDIGQPDCERVVVEGIGGPCPHCGKDDIEFDIYLERDSLTSLTVLGLERANFSKKGYQIIKD